jgi:sortase A
MMHRHTHRLIEIAAWVSGIALLATYYGMRAWSAHASDEAIDAMQRARATAGASLALAASKSAATPKLSSAQPDTSTWSAKRLAEYRESLSSKALPAAVLRIPKLSIDVPVFDGTSDFALNRGAGRIEGTAHADSPTGNVGIAGHRDGFFRPLKDVAVGDRMALETLHDTKHYQVTSIRIVDPVDVSVLEPTSDAVVTLVTCYPFYHVGAAPKRFIVQARLVTEALATDQ